MMAIFMKNQVKQPLAMVYSGNCFFVIAVSLILLTTSRIISHAFGFACSNLRCTPWPQPRPSLYQTFGLRGEAIHLRSVSSYSTAKDFHR